MLMFYHIYKYFPLSCTVYYVLPTGIGYGMSDSILYVMNCENKMMRFDLRRFILFIDNKIAQARTDKLEFPILLFLFQVRTL